MKRAVRFKRDLELVLKDRFGTALDEFKPYKAGLNELEIPAHCGYYQSKNNECFFVYDGDGELELESECVKKYDFENLNVKFLDFYLGERKHHAHADESEKRLVEDFCVLFSLNEMCEKPKIVPAYYAAILDKIFGKKA